MNTITVTIQPARTLTGRRQYRITVRAGNGETILTSGRQRLYNRQDAMNAVLNAFAEAPLVVREIRPDGTVNTRKLRA
jgi:uncharacterized protein (UPF0548 family)